MIHPQAIIDPSAIIADDVSIGPFSVIGAHVEIASGTSIASHVVVNGPTKIGRDNKIYSFASLGGDPQDKKYDGEETQLIIGDRNVIREYCTFSRGTVQDEGVTRVGDDNWIMAAVHFAHDCRVGNNGIFANNTTLAGHVVVEDFVILGGFTMVHQFCKLGAHSFAAMNSVISKDVLPYLMVSGHLAKPHGLNSEGLKRRGFSREALKELRQAYKTIYRSNLTLKDAVVQIKLQLESQRETNPQACKEVAQQLLFLEGSNRGIVR
ncbi:MAG: acyl-ACP--UDP-N-acetylglucosamine O-acyltransferase [Ectothiorhodospiraceae bacterium]|nr:acyl-ACP--UDP-N-acetylglucosamine O-acyltransferase [Ectothiorhodospiraceae bacterium]